MKREEVIEMINKITVKAIFAAIKKYFIAPTSFFIMIIIPMINSIIIKHEIKTFVKSIPYLIGIES